MKKFPDFPQGDSSEMPQTGEKGRCGSPEDPFPEAEAPQRRQIIPQLQIAPAPAEGGKEPRSQQRRRKDCLRQPGKSGVQGAQQIRHRSEKDPT